MLGDGGLFSGGGGLVDNDLTAILTVQSASLADEKLSLSTRGETRRGRGRERIVSRIWMKERSSSQTDKKARKRGRQRAIELFGTLLCFICH